jgi:hypothetical protein
VPDNDRHQREVQAVLKQIRHLQGGTIGRWRIDVPLWVMALQGLAMFLLAFCVGLGLAVLYEVAVWALTH